MIELRRALRQKSAPIVPERSVAGRTLMLLIAIMTFLSAVTLGGVVLVQKSAIAWSSDVGREVTIQIRPVAGEVMESNLRLAVSAGSIDPRRRRGACAEPRGEPEPDQAVARRWP